MKLVPLHKGQRIILKGKKKIQHIFFNNGFRPLKINHSLDEFRSTYD